MNINIPHLIIKVSIREKGMNFCKVNIKNILTEFKSFNILIDQPWNGGTPNLNKILNNINHSENQVINGVVKNESKSIADAGLWEIKYFKPDNEFEDSLNIIITGQNETIDNSNANHLIKILLELRAIKIAIIIVVKYPVKEKIINIKLFYNNWYSKLLIWLI